MTREIKTAQTDPEDPVIGHRFRGPEGETFICDSWEENRGYWMTSERDSAIRRNVSERAIGATFHFLPESVSAHGCGHMQGRGAA